MEIPNDGGKDSEPGEFIQMHNREIAAIRQNQSRRNSSACCKGQKRSNIFQNEYFGLANFKYRVQYGTRSYALHHDNGTKTVMQHILSVHLAG